MAGHQSEFLKWSWRSSLPLGTPLMVLCCLYANDSHMHVSRPLFPSQTFIPDCLFDISTYTSNTHLKCNLFKTKLLIFSPKLVSLPPFSSSGLSCHPSCCSGQLFHSHVEFFFFFFLFHILHLLYQEILYTLCPKYIQYPAPSDHPPYLSHHAVITSHLDHAVAS